MKPALGLLNPETFTEGGGGGLQEGIIHTDKAYFSIVERKDGQDKTKKVLIPALVLEYTQRDRDDFKTALQDGEGNELKGKLEFGFGNTSIASVHPGEADAPDGDVVDLCEDRVEVGVQGNTIAILQSDFHLNKNTAIARLLASLKDAGFPKDALSRVWAPDFVGYTMEIQTVVEKREGAPATDKGFSMRVVKAILAGPGAGKKKAAAEPAAKKKAAAAEEEEAPKPKKKAAAADDGDEPTTAAETAAKVLKKLAAKNDDTTISIRGLKTMASEVMEQMEVPDDDRLAVVKLFKDPAWIAKTGKSFGVTVEDDEVTFA